MCDNHTPALAAPVTKKRAFRKCLILIFIYTRFRSVNAIKIYLLILPRSMAHICGLLCEEISDVSIPVEEASSRIGAEARLVGVQGDGVSELQATQLVAEVGADVGLQEGDGVSSSHHGRSLLFVFTFRFVPVPPG